MFDLVADTELIGVIELLAELEGETRAQLLRIAELVGIRTVEYLKSYTNELRPPTTPGAPTGPAHPGHWKDVTKSLVDAYEFRVRDLDDLILLSVFNSDNEAVFLEMRHGYFVLGSVMDPGGPVEQALARAVAEVAPDWMVRG